MFEFKSETLEIEGHVFVVTEPSTRAIERLATEEPRPSLLSLCVTVDGKPLGNDELPWRIGSKLQEALNRLTQGNEDA